MEIKKFAVLVTFAAIFATILATTVTPAKGIIDITLLSKSESICVSNFTHQQVVNDLDEDKCYWLNETGLVVTNCNDLKPSNAAMIAWFPESGTPDNYTIYIDETKSNNAHCDLYVVDVNGAKRLVPAGQQNKITLWGDTTKNFSVYGYLVFKELDTAKNENCHIEWETNP